ncbi:glycosyl transferase family 90 [uncultured Shimia sp.]|uniref:glycosyl transferase family 90 n=1 Tax=uncultured Shimia sp. TaxID=573152 RepID=UPI00262B659F|nr:glycosyl transferase family 90 [uncultured Shimia sp.]
MRRALVGLRKWGEIAWWMRQTGSPMPQIRVRHSDEFTIPWDVVIEPNGSGFDVVYGTALLNSHHNQFSNTIAKVTPALYARMLSSDDVGRIVVNLSDGDYYGQAGFMYCTNWDRITPLPDWYFFRSNGFAEMRAKVVDYAKPWEARSDDFVWRGSTTGNGYFTVFPHLMTHPTTKQRMQMAAHAQGTELDFAFTDTPGSHQYAALKQRGFIADRVVNTTWFTKKYAFDIDGYSCTWDNLFHRLLMGCCVLKVESTFGFRQWYYDDMRAFEHYVPIRADCADLQEKLAWVRDNDVEARAIAEAGQALALEMTFEREMKRGAEAIEQNWARYI